MPGSPVMITNHSLQWIEAWLVHQHQCSGFGTFWSQASMYTLHYCNNIIFLKMLWRGCWKHDKSGDKKQTQSKNYSLQNLIIISDRYSSSQAEAVWMAIIRVLQMSVELRTPSSQSMQMRSFNSGEYYFSFLAHNSRVCPGCCQVVAGVKLKLFQYLPDPLTTLIKDSVNRIQKVEVY